MKLRVKLSLSLALLAIPSFMLVGWFRHGIETRSHRVRIADRLSDRLQEKPPRGCVMRPKTWRGPKRRFGPPFFEKKRPRAKRRRPRGAPERREMYAYNRDFVSANPAAPYVPPSKIEAQEGGNVWTENTGYFRQDGMIYVKVAASPECHYVGVYLRHPTWIRLDPVGMLETLAFVFGISTLTGLLASLPLLRRVSRLTNEMGKAREEHPQVPASLESSDELGDMARSFNQLGNRVQRNFETLARRDEALRSHVANTSHDLAIPLTVIQHRLRRALEQCDEAAPLRPDLKAALEESAYMASLVRNLNVSTKLEAQDIYFESTSMDLEELLRKIESRFLALASLREVDFNLALEGKSCWVQADPVLVEQCISNLVQNAIQYVDPRGHVAVLLSGREGRFVLRVIDDGPGIPDVLLTRVQQMGIRDKEVRGRHPEGLGLGLSIAKQVCELHQWSLELRNRSPEQGLEVQIQGAMTRESGEKSPSELVSEN